MFVVASQTAITPKPAEAALGDPAPWQDFETLAARFALDDLQDPAEVLADIADDALVGAIGPDQLEAAPAVVDTSLVAVEERLQGQLAAFGVLQTGAMHDHQQQKAQGIDHNMPFSAVGLLVHVHAARLTAFGGFHALTIDASCAGLQVAASSLAGLFDQHRIDGFPEPSARPAPKVAIFRLPRRKVGGQH